MQLRSPIKAELGSPDRNRQQLFTLKAMAGSGHYGAVAVCTRLE
ncbi:hypothetical protein CES86_5028 [Brucella lupini]|uniref:Uncharacterized protein n=1 Tax=Brucella lupini TaxID=255457 RepID=A0A256GCH9_9HYPH|nr:hypothetical protein CES86_5028 [Brucella lupini]